MSEEWDKVWAERLKNGVYQFPGIGQSDVQWISRVMVSGKKMKQTIEKLREEIKSLKKGEEAMTKPSKSKPETTRFEKISDVSKPDVFCKLVNRRVPMWHCTGSYTQERLVCPHMGHAVIRFLRDEATVTCNPPIGDN